MTSEQFNRNRSLDRGTSKALALISLDLARETKLAAAYECGRVYGLRQAKYEMLREKQLTREWRRPPVEKLW